MLLSCDFSYLPKMEILGKDGGGCGLNLLLLLSRQCKEIFVGSKIRTSKSQLGNSIMKSLLSVTSKVHVAYKINAEQGRSLLLQNAFGYKLAGSSISLIDTLFYSHDIISFIVFNFCSVSYQNFKCFLSVAFLFISSQFSHLYPLCIKSTSIVNV